MTDPIIALQEKLFLSFPVMILFFFSLLKTFSKGTYPNISRVVFTIFAIQISTHIFQVLTSFRCTPSETTQIGILCNRVAFVFGIVLFALLSYVFIQQQTSITLFSILLAFYMIISHVIHIVPINLIKTN